ncbi:MAG: outer membrane beta-barrel protein [Acidobacteria bacterium]|nr:outer membrane beta-barrel protein [Acidobacteriota bacterium]
MKKYSITFLAVWAVMSLVLMVPANAADKGWYLNFGAGANIPTVEYHADPGFRLSVSGGYNFNKYLGLELETGFLYNHIQINIGDIIDDIGDIPELEGILDEIGEIGDIIDDISDISIDAKQVPVLVNFMLRYANESKWEPYVGFGMGGMYISLPVSISVDEFEGSPLKFDMSTFELAYQPKAGIRRVINESMSIGVDYRFLGFGVQSVVFQTPLGNHSIMIEFNKKF